MKTNNVEKLGKLVKLLNACEINGRNKKTAANLVAQHEGYETARANTKEEFDTPTIIITTRNGNEMIVYWENFKKEWDAHRYGDYTPEEFDKGRARRANRNSIEDKHFVTIRHDKVLNKAVSKFKQQRGEQIRQKLQAAREEVRRLEKLYYSSSY